MLFHFFNCFSFLHFFPSFSFCFPFKKKFLPFFILFLFFLFSGAQNLWRHFKIPWLKVHILSWLYFLCIGSSSLFPVEIVHILVMIRLRVVYGGRRVGQVPPSYQNRQIGAFDETADAPQSGLLFSSLLFPSLLFSSPLLSSLPLLSSSPPLLLSSSPLLLSPLFFYMCKCVCFYLWLSMCGYVCVCLFVCLSVW